MRRRRPVSRPERMKSFGTESLGRYQPAWYSAALVHVAPRGSLTDHRQPF